MEKRVFVERKGHREEPKRHRDERRFRDEEHRRYRDERRFKEDEHRRHHDEFKRHKHHKRNFEKQEFFKKMMFKGKTKTKMFIDKQLMVDYVNEVGEEGYHIDIFKIEDDLYKVVVQETEHQSFEDIDVEIEIEEE